MQQGYECHQGDIYIPDSEFKEMYGILNRQHLVHLQTTAATGGIGG
jgi:hypothetical protein